MYRCLGIASVLSLVIVSAASTSPAGAERIEATTGRSNVVHAVAVLRHSKAVPHAVFSPNGQYVLTSSHDGMARVWDWRKQHVVVALRTSDLNDAVFSRDGKYVADAGVNGTVQVWDWRRRARIASLRGHTDHVESVAFSPDGRYLLSGADDNTARVWDWRKRKTVLTATEKDYVGDVAFSPDGRYFATGGGNNPVYVWDWHAKIRVRTLDATSASSVSFSANGQYLLTGNTPLNATQVWDWRKGKVLATLESPFVMFDAAFSPNNRYVVTASASGLFDFSPQVWDWRRRKILVTLRGHSTTVNSAAFSPDGAYIVTGSDDNTARIWHWQGR